jgi:hypothetical protein
MRWAADNDRVVITVDHKIKSRPHELAVWRDSGLRVAFLAKAFVHLQFFEQASKILGAWPRIVEAASKLQPSECLHVSVNMKIQRL